MGNSASSHASSSSSSSSSPPLPSSAAPVDGGGSERFVFQGAVTKLISRHIARDAGDEWRRLWEWPRCSDDVWSKFSFPLIRTLRVKNPYNLSALIAQCVEKIESFMLEDDPAALPQGDDYTQRLHVLNCVRLLTRCIPVALESRTDQLYQDFLWQGIFPQDPPGVENGHVDGNLRERIHPPSPAVRIMQALLRLLFVPGFTTPAEGHPRMFLSQNFYEIPGVDPAKVWPGVYSGTDSSFLDRNRAEVLKCILACSAQGLFVSSKDFRHDDNPWLQYMVGSTNELAPTLLASLLEVAASFQSASLPYSHALFEDYREPLLQVSLQVLIVFLDFRTLDHPATSENSTVISQPTVDHIEEGDTEAERRVENVMLHLIGKIRLAPNLSLLFDGLSRLLNNCLDVGNAYLPNSIKQIACYQEVLILLWKVLDANEDFTQFVASRADQRRLLMPLLFLACSSRQEAGKVGMVHTCALLLLKLSAERDFAVAFNTPCEKMPIDLNVASGSIADMLIIITHEILVDSSTFVDSLYTVLLTTLCNVSPYMRTLNWESSSKLLHMFEMFSSPHFLYSGRNHHQFVTFMLEIFNNIIQYQYNGNGRLIYGITQKSKRFFELGRIPVVRGNGRNNPMDTVVMTREISASIRPQFEEKSPDSDSSNSPHSISAPEPRQRDAETNVPLEKQALQQQPEPANEPDVANAVDNVDHEPSQECTENESDLKETDKELEEDREFDKTQYDVASTGYEEDASKVKDQAEKMMPRSASSVAESVDPSAVRGSRFGPSVDWIVSWKRSLPLGPVYRMLEFFLPRMNVLTESGGIHSERKVLEFFQNATLVGILPLPHSIVVRRYKKSKYTATWLSSFIWSIVFLRHQRQLLFDPSSVRLFAMSQSGGAATDQ